MHVTSSRSLRRAAATGILPMLLVLTAMLAGPSGSAAGGSGTPDWDGDGAIATDCRPLDPAVHPAAVDHPDLTFEDLDCDGIDGDREGAYFVAPGGNDSNVGTPNAPFQTLQKAINVARTSATKSIYMATGTYTAGAGIPTDGDGIRIYGGYEAGTWGRVLPTSAQTRTQVTGEQQALALDGAINVVVQLVRLTGNRATPSGLNAYGIRAVNGSELALIRSTVTVGAGGAGSSGSNGSQPARAGNGANGSMPVNCDTIGSGGFLSQGGVGHDGGAGGAGGNHTNDGENGQTGTNGQGPLGGLGGAGGTDQPNDPDPPDWAAMQGKAGSPGGTGANGANGGGGGNDLGAAGATWAGRSGTDATNGGPGHGGGGGGSGAGRGSLWNWQAGAGGGQGGEGGAGGTRGTGGQWGGASVGLYLHSSAGIVVDGSSLTSGAGGNGGAGGAGGDGGLGGLGGQGGGIRPDCNKTSGGGGAGGNGGAGGDGGNGGGGSGGPSAAIMRIGPSATSQVRSSTLGFGSAGSGGAGGGAAGVAGSELGAPGGVTDFDSDGLTDTSDACVDVPRGTDANGDGCPDRAAALPDGDGDGVPNDGRDQCPSAAAGTDANHDGCTDSTSTAPSTGGGGGSGSGDATGGGTASTTSNTSTTSSSGGQTGVTAPASPPTGLTFTIAPRQKLRKALSSGLVVTGACAQPCRLDGRVLLSGKLARKHKLSKSAKSLVIARGSAKAEAGQKARLTLRFTSKAKSRLRRLRSVRLSVVVTPSNAGGAGRPATRATTLRR